MCDINVCTNVGRYDWCGTPDESGHFLCENTIGNVNEKTQSQMVKLTMDATNEHLLNSTSIMVFDETGFLARYTYRPLPRYGTISLFFQLKYCNTKVKPSDLIVKFVKVLPKPEHLSIFARAPTKTIYETTVTVPIVYDKEERICSICLDEVDKVIHAENTYISHCKHIFHMDCIWTYLKQNDYLLENNCTYCKHSQKTKPFPCPLCKTQLEDNKITV